MTARRPLFLSALFVASVWAVGKPTPAAAQQDPPRTMTPEEIRAALGRIGGLPADQDAFFEQVRRQVQQLGWKFDEKDLRETVDRIRNDPQKMAQLERMAREQANTGRPADPGELGNALRKSGLDKFAPPRRPEGLPPGGPPPRATDSRPPSGTDGRKGDGSQPAFPKPFEITRPNDKGPGRGDGAGKGGPQFGGKGEGPVGGRWQNPDRPPEPRDPFSSRQSEQHDQARRTVEALWEKNIGPLQETPTVRRLLFDVVAGSDDLTDSTGRNFWDALGKDAGDGSSIGDWFDKGGLGGDWKMPSLDIGSTSMGGWFGGSSRDVSVGDLSSGSSRGGSGGMGSLGFGGLEGSWLPVVLLTAVLLGALVWWRFWLMRDPARSGWELPAGLGDWPLDPRRIATREDLVRAFEYLSVRICGLEARTWTHGTIAQALTGLAATHGETAVLLARLYELARYAPLDEPLSRDDLAEGRDIVCQLAGVRTA